METGFQWNVAVENKRFVQSRRETDRDTDGLVRQSLSDKIYAKARAHAENDVDDPRVVDVQRKERVDQGRQVGVNGSVALVERLVAGTATQDFQGPGMTEFFVAQREIEMDAVLKAPQGEKSNEQSG